MKLAVCRREAGWSRGDGAWKKGNAREAVVVGCFAGGARLGRLVYSMMNEPVGKQSPTQRKSAQLMSREPGGCEQRKAGVAERE